MCNRKTPSSTAAAALPGIPSTRSGMRAPPTVAVDAACGATTPLGEA